MKTNRALLILCVVSVFFSRALFAADISSLRIDAPPLLFGGFSFEIDQTGLVEFQSIGPSEKKGLRFQVTRYRATDRASDFKEFSSKISLNKLLAYRETKRPGVPDELRIHILATLSDGSRVKAEMWANDEDTIFTPLLKHMHHYVQERMIPSIKPDVLDYESLLRK